MNRILKKSIAVVITAIVVFACMSISSFAMKEMPMGFSIDAGKSTADYLDIVYSSELYDKAASDKKINIYYSDSTKYITERDEFEAALEAGDITYVTSISSAKAEIKKNEYNYYGMELNAVRIYWSEANLGSEGWYLIHIESGALVSDDGEYGNAEAFVPNQKGPSTNFFTEIINNIKAFFESIVEWFKNLFSF